MQQADMLWIGDHPFWSVIIAAIVLTVCALVAIGVAKIVPSLRRYLAIKRM